MTRSGWYAVATTSADRTSARIGSDRLVVWTDAHGDRHVHDAICPHLGADLGHVSHVTADGIQCGFHGWTFGADGRCRGVPYADHVPDASIRRREAAVAADVVFVHHGSAPECALPEFPWFVRADAIAPPPLRFGVVEATVEDFVENAADTAHFGPVHATAATPRLLAYDFAGPVARIDTATTYATPEGAVDGRLDLWVVPGGVNYAEYQGLFDGGALATYTPIDDSHVELELRFRFAPETSAGLVDAFVRSSEVQVRRDLDIWSHRVHHRRPRLLAEDGPILELRAWTERMMPSVR